MPRTKNIDGVKVKLSAAEESERNAEETKWIAEKPMQSWLTEIVASDSLMSRHMEDLIDDSGIIVTGRTKTNYDTKKAIRARKP